MKSLSIASLLLTTLILPVSGQEAIQLTSKEVRVKIKRLSLQMQQTPNFSAENVTEKRWKPKEWLEIETEFEAVKSPEKLKQDKSKYVDSLEFRYYVAFQAKDPATGNSKYVMGKVAHINVPTNSETASVMYISPASLIQIMDNERPAESDILAVGVEVYYNGELCAAPESKGSGNAGWWKASEKLSDAGDVLLNKTKTPFAPLWGDYHADVQQN